MNKNEKEKNKEEIEEEDSINIKDRNKKILKINEEKEEKSSVNDNDNNKELLKLESVPIEEPKELSYRAKIKNPQAKLIINQSNLYNQFTSTEINKDNKDDNNENKIIKNEEDNKTNNIEEKNKEDNKTNNIEEMNKEDNKTNNIEEMYKEDFKNDNNIDNKLNENNNEIKNDNINTNSNIKNNNEEEINTDINVNQDNNLEHNTDINDGDIVKENNIKTDLLLTEEEFKNEKDNNSKININTDINYDKIEIVNESSANRVNVSKKVKLHDSPMLTLYELMDEPSYSKIYVDFPEIKEIKFTKDDFGGETNKNIRKLIINGIPKSFLNIKVKEKPRNISIYTPHKIKTGKNYLITKKLNKDTNNINNIIRDDNYDEINEKKIHLKNFQLKNLNNYESQNKKNRFIFSPNYRNNKYIKSNTNNILLNNNNELNNCNEYYRHYSKPKIGIKMSKSQSKIKIGGNINSITAQRTTSPLFKKKINVIHKNNNNVKLNNLGNIIKKEDN